MPMTPKMGPFPAGEMSARHFYGRLSRAIAELDRELAHPRPDPARIAPLWDAVKERALELGARAAELEAAGSNPPRPGGAVRIGGG